MEETQARETILVADDEPIVLKLAGTILRRSGYNVISADDGNTALELFRKQHVHLVLTDVVMPAMSGPQLMHQIHAEKAGVPCIFMSGYSAEQIKEKGAGNPGCDYLRKPFTADMLLDMVRRQLAA